MLKKGIYLTFTTLLLFASCSNDDTDNQEGEIETFVLAEIAGGGAFIINQEGEEVYNFDLDFRLGNDGNLIEDGSFVAAVRAENPDITIGGFGGRFIKQNANKTLDWEINYSFIDKISHHDVEYLSNGNILFLVWDRLANAEAQNIGFEGVPNILLESVIEMNPLTQEIVWEWHMEDHIVQDVDATKPNFGEIVSNPNKIDLNFNKDRTDGDIVHFNGLFLDEESDLIYLTANFYNEIWILDHSTSSAEAATSSGGNSGLGGDLVYRFGNPEAYQNFEREVFFDRVHTPNLLDTGNLLVFSNQETRGQSEAVEFKLPEVLSLEEDAYQEPEVVWSFTDPDLFTAIMGNAERLRNGNTLIDEGTAGTIWEVTPEGEVIWQYETDPAGQWVWRAYVFYSDDPGFEALGIE